MMNLEQIRNIRFHTERRGGYVASEVDRFIEDVVSAFEAVLAERNVEKRRLEEAEKELAACRARERSVGEALLVAQHQASVIVSEAQSRAELMVEEAKTQAKEVLDSVSGAQNEREKVMNDLRQEVTEFKGRLLQMYKEHLTLIDSMPEYTREEPAAAAEEAPVEEPVAEAAPVETAAEETATEEMPVIESHSEGESDFVAEMAPAEEETFSTELTDERFAGLQFGEDYENPTDKGFFQRKK